MGKSGIHDPVSHQTGAARANRAAMVLPILILILVAFAVHAGTLLNGFVDDDRFQVLENPWIRDARRLPEIFAKGVWGFLGDQGVSNYYRPLMHVIYMVTCHLFGLKAWAFHLVNLLFHAANTMMVFLLASRLQILGTSPEASDSGSSPVLHATASVPFAAGLIFAVHPAGTEAVAWIASLPELSYTFFFLAALWLHARTPRPLATSHALTAVAFIFALACKETALTLLLALPAWDLAFGAKRRGLREHLLIHAPFWLAAAVYLAARYHALSRTVVVVSDSHGLSSSGLVLSASWLLAVYLGTILMPVGLSFWHSFEPVTSIVSARSAAGIAVVLGLLWGLVLAFRKDRAVHFALLIGVVSLLPALYIEAIPGKPFAERYLYLPGVGFITAALLLLFRLTGNRRRLAWMVLIPILALCAAATVSRDSIWRDDLTLYAETVRRSPDAAMPRYLLALALHSSGKIDEAIVHYRILVDSDPRDTRFQAAYGDALMLKGRLDEAIEHLQAAVEGDPRAREAYDDLGTALHGKGRTVEAVEAYRKALEIDPDYAEAHYNLGAVLAGTGRLPEALEHLARAVRLRPDDAHYRNVLGIEYAKRGLMEDAIEQLEAAVRLRPDEPGYRRNLERIQRGRP